jgi:hypothetical protein
MTSQLISRSVVCKQANFSYIQDSSALAEHGPLDVRARAGVSLEGFILSFLFPEKTPAKGQVSSIVRPYISGCSQSRLHFQINHLRQGAKSSKFFLALALGAGTLLAPKANAQSPVQASPANAFVDSMGVDTHMLYTNTLYYTNWPQVFADLQALGIRHVRDGYFDPNWGAPYTTEHQQLAQAGIRTDYVLSYDPTISSQDIEQLAATDQDMELLEAPNECDLAGACGSGITGSLNNMISMMPTIQTAASALGVPVIGPSFAAYQPYSWVGDIAALMSYNNLHVYFGGRNPGVAGWGSPDAEGNPYGTFQFWLDMSNLDAPGLPAQITETGYMTFPGNPTPYTVPMNVEAQYLIRTYFLAYMNGIGRSYVYELLEDPNSPGFGLIDGNLNPRPAYYEIQNLIANLSDPGPSFTPGQLPYSVTGGDQTLNQLLLQKRDGSYWLILWLEQSAYDEVNLINTPVTPQQVTLTLGSNYFTPNVGQFDDNGNLNWSSTQIPNGNVPLTISDHPTIVKVLQY